MDLLDRYLQAVKKHLPWQRQDDIVAELRANLESQLEDREAELGRPLTAPEVEAWLKQMGPPMHVAARYQPQQYLIGPTVFPIYFYVLKMACAWALIIYAIVSAIQLMTGTPSGSAAIEAIVRIPGVLFSVAAWVTLVSAAIEFAIARGLIKLPVGTCTSVDWNPGALPPAEEMIANVKKRRTIVHAASEVVFGYLFLIWLLLIPQHPYLWLGPGALYFKASPYALAHVWWVFYGWAVAMNAFQLAWKTWDLWRGTWRGPRLAQKIAFGILGLIPLVVLLTARGREYLLLKNPALAQLSERATLDSTNQWIYKAIVLILVIAVATVAWEIGKAIVKAHRTRVAAR